MLLRDLQEGRDTCLIVVLVAHHEMCSWVHFSSHTVES